MRDKNKSGVLEKIARSENLQIKEFEIDVNKDHFVYDTIVKIATECGRINVLVNNAGYGLFGALEDLSMDEIKNQFNTNVFSVIRVIRGVLSIMRQQKNAKFINLSKGQGLLSSISSSQSNIL